MQLETYLLFPGWQYGGGGAPTIPQNNSFFFFSQSNSMLLLHAQFWDAWTFLYGTNTLLGVKGEPSG